MHVRSLFVMVAVWILAWILLSHYASHCLDSAFTLSQSHIGMLLGADMGAAMGL